MNLDLLAVQAVIDRHQHAAGRRDPVVRLEQSGDVLGDERHPIALPQARAEQRGREPAHPLTHLAIGVAPVLVHDGDFVRTDQPAPLQKAHRAELGPWASRTSGKSVISVMDPFLIS